MKACVAQLCEYSSAAKEIMLVEWSLVVWLRTVKLHRLPMPALVCPHDQFCVRAHLA